MSRRLRTRLRAGTGLAVTSLNLEFATAAGGLDPRITFSRGSQAMVTDATGKLTYAPNNLLTYSALTGGTAGVEGSGAVAPTNWSFAVGTGSVSYPAAIYGPGTAIRFVASSQRPFITQTSFPALTANTNYIYSAYVEAVSSGSPVIRDVLSYNSQLPGSSITYYVNGASVADTTVVAAGQRISALWAVGATGGTMLPRLGLGGSGNVTGDITMSSPQFEAVTYQTTPSPYVSTTPKNLLGYTQEFDNAAWTKGNAAAYPFDPATATQGPELVTNGDFSGGSTGWTNSSTGTGTFTVSGGAATIVGTDGSNRGAFSQNIGAVFGKFYKITFNATITSGAGSFFGTAVGNAGVAINNGSNEVYFQSGFNGSFFVYTNLGGGNITIDNISVKELSGGLITAPDGSLTADKLVENTANALHEAYSATITGTLSTPYTYSVYAKAAERTWLAINAYATSSAINYFDLLTGSLGTSAAGCTNTITPVGNGWYRCTVTRSAPGTSLAFGAQLASANNTTTYTGDGTSGIYIWGAQLSNSASVDPYVYNPGAAPTSTAYYGPRFDYDPVTLAPRGLLIEEQRTNLLTASEDFARWSASSVTVAANTTVAPDGQTSADTITASATSGFVARTAAFTGDGDKAYSVFLKAGTSTTTRLTLRDITATVNRGSVDITWTAGVPSGVATFGTLQGIDSFGNGWYRVRMLATGVVAANTNQFRFSPDISAGTGTAIFWGAQTENGSFATSYIPTAASTVTRSADVALMQGANFSQWYNQSEGTFVVGYNVFNVAAAAIKPTVVVYDGTTNNRIYGFVSSDTPFVLVTTAGVSQANISSSTVSANTINKMSFAYKTDDIAISSNGGTVGTDTSAIVPTVSQFGIGSFVPSGVYLNGHIRQITYYNTRLPNLQLQALTS